MKKLYLLLLIVFQPLAFSAHYEIFNSSEFIYYKNGSCIKDSVSIADTPNGVMFLYEPKTTPTAKKKKYSTALSYLRSQGANSTSLKLIMLNSSANEGFSKVFTDSLSPALMTKHNSGGVVIVKHFASGRAEILHLRKKIGIISEKILQKKQIIKDIITAKNGDIITISQIKHTTQKFGGGLGGNDILLTRFNPSLRIKWQKIVGTSKDDNPKSVIETADLNILVGAVSHDGNSSDNLTFLKTDSNGNKKWFHTYEWAGKQNLYSMELTDQNNYLINATFQNENNRENIWLFELDSNANIKWQMRYFRDNSEALYDLIALENEQYIGVGFSEINYNKDALVRVFEKNGTISHQSTYGGDNSDFFNKVTLLNNENLYVSGCSSSIDKSQASSWVLKLQPSLALANKISPPFDKKILVRKLKNEILKPLKDWRIKMDKNLRFSFEHPRLHFAQGSTSLNNSHKTVLKSFFTKLLSVISDKKIISHVKAIRIEGFASSEYNSNSKVSAFLGNAELSQDRALSVLRYILNLDTKNKEWLMDRVSVDGYSYSKRKFKTSINPKKEDFKASRRIEIALEVE